MEHLAQAAALLSAAERVWLGTHLSPDGDAIGSLLGLGWILHDMGKSTTLACQDPAPSEVSFLPGVMNITDRGPAGHDLAVALDAADAGRLGRVFDAEAWGGMPTIVMDHHVSNRGFGTVNVVDPAAAATAEIVVALAGQLGAPLCPRAATCLLAGVVSDTIGFRTASTRAATLELASRLMADGADLVEITQNVFYCQPLVNLMLFGRAIARLQVEGPFALTALSRDDFVEFGARPDEVGGISSLLATAAEPAAVAVLRERDDGRIDISLRSKVGVDLVPAATALGGGGHPQAAGALVDGPLAAATVVVLAALRAHVALGAPWGGAA